MLPFRASTIMLFALAAPALASEAVPEGEGNVAETVQTTTDEADARYDEILPHADVVLP